MLVQGEEAAAHAERSSRYLPCTGSECFPMSAQRKEGSQSIKIIQDKGRISCVEVSSRKTVDPETWPERSVEDVNLLVQLGFDEFYARSPKLHNLACLASFPFLFF